MPGRRLTIRIFNYIIACHVTFTGTCLRHQHSVLRMNGTLLPSIIMHLSFAQSVQSSRLNIWPGIGGRSSEDVSVREAPLQYFSLELAVGLSMNITNELLSDHLRPLRFYNFQVHYTEFIDHTFLIVQDWPLIRNDHAPSIKCRTILAVPCRRRISGLTLIVHFASTTVFVIDSYPP